MKCMKDLKKSILSFFLSGLLVCCLVCLPCFNLPVYASPSLLDRLVDFVFPSHEEPWYAKDVRYVQNMMDPPFKGKIQWFDESSGSHGGGGHSRNEPIIKDTNPSVPSSMINVTYSNHETYLDCFNPEYNTYETINNFYTDNSQTYICETDNYFITYEFNETYYSIYVAPVQSPTEGKFFNVYYQLPDGRNSFNLTPDDIRGVVFNYDVVNYNRTVLDSNVLGLWRLDGNYYNSLYGPQTYYNLTASVNFVDGRFGGGVQLLRSTDYCRLFLEDSRPNDWTLEFWLYVPYQNTILQSSVYGGDLYNNIVGYDDLNVAFTQNAWNYVVYQSNNRVWVNGYEIPKPSFFDSFISFTTGNDEIIFKPCLIYDSNNNVETHVVGGSTYYLGFGYGSVVDEVLFRSGLYYASTNEDIRLEPFDLPFAYTVPELPLVYERGSLDVSFSTNGDPVSDFADVYFNGNLTSFVPDNSNYSFYHLFDCTFPDGTTYPINVIKDRFDTILNNSNGPLKVKFRCYRNPYNLNTYVNPYFYNSDGEYINFLVCDLGVFKGEVGCVVYPVQSLYFLKESINSCIGIQSPFDVNNLQVGGIRPLYPNDGDVYISFFRGVVSSVIQYYQGIWHDINASVFYRGQWIDVKEFDFTNLMLISDSQSLSNPSGGTYIINQGSTYNYYGVSGNDFVTVSGNEPLNVVVDTRDTDVSKLTDFINGIPKIFGFVIALLTLLFPFLPVWLSGLFSVCFIVLFTAFIIVLIKRQEVFQLPSVIREIFSVCRDFMEIPFYYDETHYFTYGGLFTIGICVSLIVIVLSLFHHGSQQEV